MGLAWFILIVVPIAGIVLFWLVHILPEKIAHTRHHPQRANLYLALGGGFEPPAATP